MTDETNSPPITDDRYECPECGGERGTIWNGLVGFGICGCFYPEKLPCLEAGDFIIDRNFDLWEVQCGARFQPQNIVTIWRCKEDGIRHMPIWRRKFTIKEKEDAQVDSSRNYVLIHEGNGGSHFLSVWKQWGAMLRSLFRVSQRISKNNQN